MIMMKMYRVQNTLQTLSGNNSTVVQKHFPRISLEWKLDIIKCYEEGPQKRLSSGMQDDHCYSTVALKSNYCLNLVFWGDLEKGDSNTKSLTTSIYCALNF